MVIAALSWRARDARRCVQNSGPRRASPVGRRVTGWTACSTAARNMRTSLMRVSILGVTLWWGPTGPHPGSLDSVRAGDGDPANCWTGIQ